MYVDTSVLVKLYVDEPDSEACEAITAGAMLVTSRLAYCEFQSALMAKVSLGNISAFQKDGVWRAFENDLAGHMVRFVPLSDILVRDASDLLSELHPDIPLRTLDALHLATFLSTEAGPLFTKDLRMLRAATRLGLPLAG